jgi:DNA-binding CsgD family transcriptional regulator
MIQESNYLFKFLSGLEFDPKLPLYHQQLFENAELNNILTLGRQFYYIADLKAMNIVFASKNIEIILGYKIEDISLKKMYDIIHPDDRKIIAKATEKTIQFAFDVPSEPFEYVFNMDYRIKKASGNYLRMLRQTCMFKKDNSGKMVLTLAVYTDISHIKKGNCIDLTYTGPDLNIFKFPDEELLVLINKDILTNAELNILGLLSNGKTSKEIANILSISSHTVDTHRRNMLCKTGTRNIRELIAFAMEKGLKF